MKIYSIIIGYSIGGMCGWILELFFRRIVHKKWINPGFLNGPFIPLYGFGVVILYFISDLSISWYYKAILFLVLLTLIEYIAGIIFIKGMHIKLWDYSSRWGNIQGIVFNLISVACPAWRWNRKSWINPTIPRLERFWREKNCRVIILHWLIV